MRDFIETHTKNFGKAKLVLYRNRYFIEIQDDMIYETLSNIEAIKESQIKAQELKDQKEKIIDIEADLERKDNVLQILENNNEEVLINEFDNLFDFNDNEDKEQDEDIIELNRYKIQDQPENIKRIEIDPKDVILDAYIIIIPKFLSTKILRKCVMISIFH